nr:diadenylate cyclase CdaA [Aequitasia blattaphilus]
MQSIERFFGTDIYFPRIHFTDILEIVILTFLIYQLIRWINNTKAWMLLKGILVLAICVLVATILRMHTILYLVRNSITVMATAVVVVFQPELRRALEKLGEKQFLTSVINLDGSNRESIRFSDATKRDIVDATFAMSNVKTGALIVVEQAIQLTEYETTGIRVDAAVSKQLLLNIFEHNTPLHDGAVIMRGDRIISATSYLPLTDSSNISKELGTRHRAALGLSEVSDALIVVVSEETGFVSVAQSGKLDRNITRNELEEWLTQIQIKANATSNWMGRIKGRVLKHARKDSK